MEAFLQTIQHRKKKDLGVFGLVLDKSVGLNLEDSLCEKVLFSNY